MRSAAKMGKKLCKKKKSKGLRLSEFILQMIILAEFAGCLSTEIYGQLKLKEAIEMPLKRPAN